MGSFPGSPPTLRGAIVAVDEDSSAPVRTVLFQYNPDEVTRQIQPRAASGEASDSQDRRLWGAPVETLSLTVEVDATDQLEAADPVAVEWGVLPALAVLELLLSPSSREVQSAQAALRSGALEVLPPRAPLTLLVWGTSRVVPVTVTGLSVTEQAYNTRLNPGRAEVEISLTVLTWDDLPLDSVGSATSIAHLVAKEQLAAKRSGPTVTTVDELLDLERT
jgi:hypothetical protein